MLPLFVASVRYLEISLLISPDSSFDTGLVGLFRMSAGGAAPGANWTGASRDATARRKGLQILTWRGCFLCACTCARACVCACFTGLKADFSTANPTSAYDTSNFGKVRT